VRRALNIAGYIAIALACLVLWPQRWGGTMTYDITHGISMKPAFHTGDLAILRKSSSYQVGDVAAYRSPSLHTTVMHRIKTADHGHYTFKGDNNSFTDPDTVTDKQLLGRLLLRVPKVGLGLGWLVQPVHLAIAVAGIFLLFSDRRDRKEDRPVSPAQAVRPSAGAPPLVVRITAMRLPQDLPSADVASAEDLEQLARLHAVAILRDDDADYVLQGGMLFRCTRTAQVSLPRTGGRHAAPEAPPPTNVVQIAGRRAVS
jgi:signal peptidase I